MIDFSGDDAKAKEIALHYAGVLKNSVVLNMLANNSDVVGNEQALVLAQFYWQMLDMSALDAEQGNDVCGLTNNQYWMERLLNIIGGYLQRRGFGDLWQRVCDEA